MKQFPSLIRRPSALGAVAALLTFGATLTVSVPEAQAASTVRVRSIVRSQVTLSESVGSVVSIVHVCPPGSA